MGPANKVLTVSYGTFSCTLEGFEDPFSAMREIAEYFRDLAAKDRYFGAEPPELDIATVKELAESKSDGQIVEAEADGPAVTLRATSVNGALGGAAGASHSDDTGTAIDRLTRIRADDAESDVTPADVTYDEAEIDAAPADVIDGEHPDSDADLTTDTETTETIDALAAEDDVEEDFADSESIDVASDMLELPGTADEAASLEADDEVQDALEELASATDAETLSEADEAIVEDFSAADVEASFDDVDQVPDEDVDPADDEPVAAQTEGEIAAIPANPFTARLEAVAEAEASEDEIEAAEETDAEFFASEDAPEIVAEAAEDEETVESDVAHGDEAETAFATTASDIWNVEDDGLEEFDQLTDEEEAALENASAVPTKPLADESVASESDDADDEGAGDTLIDGESVRDRVARRFEIRKARKSGALESLSTAREAAPTEPRRPMEPVQTAAERLAEEAEPEPEAMQVIDLPSEEEDDLMAELAAIEADMVEARDDEADLPEEDAVGHGFLSADDDDEQDEDLTVLSELAAIRSGRPDTAPLRALSEEEADDDILSDEAEDMAASEIDDASDLDASTLEIGQVADNPEAAAPQGTRSKSRLNDPDGPDMERLFAATDSRLTGEDASRRHANISHLKAAVAARRADDGDGPEEPEDDATDVYRADLANTVRPRRTQRPERESVEARTERPEKPSPLVLVSEQRVESEAQEESADVQPRRPAAPKPEEAKALDEAVLTPALPTPATNDGPAGFEKFAAEVGAVELPEILEAAAVYSVKVMGEDVFSRPHLLHLASEAVEDLSREDGLRGFGQLLRDGTLRKVSRGTFSLGTTSRFAESADRAVG
ncbi:MAG: hypothetical protein AAF919_06365 [Pseudomonadota bacterium]